LFEIIPYRYNIFFDILVSFGISVSLRKVKKIKRKVKKNKT